LQIHLAWLSIVDSRQDFASAFNIWEEDFLTRLNRASTLSDGVYAFLKERILSGEYPIGFVLVESEVSTQLGVSRTPVSNALLMLKERGLVVQRGNKLEVPKRTLKDLIHLYECRLALDGLAAGLAARHITGPQLAQLEAYLLAWDEPDAQQPLWVADLRFHDLIYEVPANPHLLHFARSATELAAAYRRDTLQPKPTTSSGRTLKHVRAEHGAILAALIARDPESAEKAAREHIENVITHLYYLEVTGLEAIGRNVTQGA
jgi:DNA-binding GntR family transcriptional regulator